MRKLFFVAAALLVAFELANVWLIMPLPGSQRMTSIDVAYRLYAIRWFVRAGAGLLLLAGLRGAWQPTGWRRALVAAALVLTAGVAYVTNYVMAADRIFIAPASLSMQPASRNVVDPARLVVGVALNGEARAYPVQFIGYHHQVRDTVGGMPVLVSFCTVCRTGRVFDPVIDGVSEQFRLVGMDHFNAMFEDARTGSWWRQANGEAIAGPRAGRTLKELPSRQVTLAQWLALHPSSLIMQPDSALASRYSKSFDYETGASRSKLTGTDTISWRDKAWVVGITAGGTSKAYDWNRLRREGVINDTLGGLPIVLALAGDRASFFAFVRPNPASEFALRGDSLVAGANAYALSGKGAEGQLSPLNASQEFWHSWRTFHPDTRY
jgi:hypothetical protein